MKHSKKSVQVFALLLVVLISQTTLTLALTWFDSGDVRWAFNCDYNGNDIGRQQSSGEQCGGICTGRGDCSHFTWTNYNGGTCWLKGGAASESSAVGKNNDNAVCGFLKSRSGGGGSGGGISGSGTTTRYWDCCKPSCSWQGKASVTAPVRTCAKSPDPGVTPSSGPNEASGCGGGPAFVCNSQVPFDGPNGIAYGYAAAVISGKSERDTCCACYELTFTSGPVNGQKMVVQVTNTGADLGSNHFDLQIPGGGVGIFNGCSSQWGAPADGWGARYGGVSSQAQCGELPWQLRAGCNWRFTWFKNADNPSMNFREVSCPKEITDRTGCMRS